MAYVTTERRTRGALAPQWSGWLAPVGLLLGAGLTFKDDVLLTMRAIVDWAQQAEGIREFIAEHWRHYRATLTPADMGFDGVEVVGVAVMAMALVGMLSRASSTRRHPAASRTTGPHAAADPLS